MCSSHGQRGWRRLEQYPVRAFMVSIEMTADSKLRLRTQADAGHFCRARCIGALRMGIPRMLLCDSCDLHLFLLDMR